MRDFSPNSTVGWGRLPVRAGLLFLLLASLSVGLWAQFAPASFYQDFPAFGRAWVAVDGPYNEHLIRDVGGLQLAMVVVLLAAFLRPSVALVRLAALADQLAQSLLLVLTLAVAVALLFSTPR